MSVAATKLILRQAEQIEAGLSIPAGSAPHLLLVNPSPGMLAALQPTGWQFTSWVLNAQALPFTTAADFRAAHTTAADTTANQSPLTDKAAETGNTTIFSAALTEMLPVAGVILNIPKEKQLTVMLLANLRAAVPEGTPIWLVGHNDVGIRSYLKQEHAGWQKWQKVANGNHCQLLQSELSAAATFVLNDYQQHYSPSISAGDAPIDIISFPGVFSSGRLDSGTERLLQNLPPYIAGRVLDFGCGAGVISKYLARHYPITELHSVDINVLALAATTATLGNENTFKHRVYASDGLNAVSGQFDWIISNPPFHAGKHTDYQITQNFIHASQKKLAPRGSLVLVANTFLPYREALAKAFKQVNTLLETPKFTVWHATNGQKGK